MKTPDLFLAGYLATEARLLPRYDLAVEGIENVPDEPVIFAVNHLHFDDSLLVAAAMYRARRTRVRFGAKKEYFEGGGIDGKYPRAVEFMMKSTRQIPVDRTSDDLQAFLKLEDDVADVLDRGDSAALHPEGTRSPDGRLYRLRSALAHISIDLGRPIAPAGLAYGDKPGRGRRPVMLRFGEPIYPPTVGPELRKTAAVRMVTAQTQAAIAELSGQEIADEFAPIGTVRGGDDS